MLLVEELVSLVKECTCCKEPLPDVWGGLKCVTCKNGLDRYGLDKPAQLRLWESQGKCCKLCGQPVKMFRGQSGDGGVIDHDHKNKRVRGILCSICNSLVGRVENFDLVPKLIEFLGVAQR